MGRTFGSCKRKVCSFQESRGKSSSREQSTARHLNFHEIYASYKILASTESVLAFLNYFILLSMTKSYNQSIFLFRYPMDFLMWFIIIAVWVLIIYFRNAIYSWTGDWGWATQYLWANGTMNALVLIWAILIFFGTSYPFWGLDTKGWIQNQSTTSESRSQNP